MAVVLVVRVPRKLVDTALALCLFVHVGGPRYPVPALARIFVCTLSNPDFISPNSLSLSLDTVRVGGWISSSFR